MIDNPLCDVVLGKVPGATFECVEVTAAVQTRAQKARDERPFRPLLTAKAPKLDVTPDKVASMQRQDSTLRALFDKASSRKASEDDSSVVSFTVQDDLLYRKVYSKKSKTMCSQLVVPEPLRSSVLIAAHDGLFGGHMGAGSTFKRISPYFFWPGYRKVVQEHCRSWDSFIANCLVVSSVLRRITGF